MRILEDYPKKRTWKICRYGPYTGQNRWYTDIGPLYTTDKRRLDDRVLEWTRKNFFFEASLKFEKIWVSTYRTVVGLKDADDNVPLDMSADTFSKMMAELETGKYVFDPATRIFRGIFTFESVGGYLLVALKE